MLEYSGNLFRLLTISLRRTLVTSLSCCSLLLCVLMMSSTISVYLESALALLSGTRPVNIRSLFGSRASSRFADLTCKRKRSSSQVTGYRARLSLKSYLDTMTEPGFDPTTNKR
jgi:hypothetical protein